MAIGHKWSTDKDLNRKPTYWHHENTEQGLKLSLQSYDGESDWPYSAEVDKIRQDPWSLPIRNIDYSEQEKQAKKGEEIEEISGQIRSNQESTNKNKRQKEGWETHLCILVDLEPIEIFMRPVPLKVPD